ncbi:hypothetical protein DICPUDRAFT_153869 [Dictyostelium purpureum]|uniref:Uncharacterized protein n=1 Tax=Dictyostelium purpureum TaxID=5786 RepID=F0ZPY3_DICPU|nr:uncharacterized protein DICPUDRAFT_153869 [Dictyostelium purpureum]EGC33997.1 hypothetical protein DICPUDRAFT_153869 [Dictyostelium purpureum]|eukprot:XP_003289483.1 hypothetical protein DICPUDRAFT_153869 [Dictyostelium purpureum]
MSSLRGDQKNNTQNNNNFQRGYHQHPGFQNQRRVRNKTLAFAILSVIGLGLLFPLAYINLMQDKPTIETYPKGSGVRGSFLNSGSNDIGKESKRYKNNYEEHKRRMLEAHLAKDLEKDQENNSNSNNNNNKDN